MPVVQDTTTYSWGNRFHPSMQITRIWFAENCEGGSYQPILGAFLICMEMCGVDGGLVRLLILATSSRSAWAQQGSDSCLSGRLLEAPAAILRSAYRSTSAPAAAARIGFRVGFQQQ